MKAIGNIKKEMSFGASDHEEEIVMMHLCYERSKLKVWMSRTNIYKDFKIKKYEHAFTFHRLDIDYKKTGS